MTDAIQKAREALASIPHGAIDALANNQRQLDMDGCEVGVSRQAVDEVLAGLRAALAALAAETEVKVRELEWYAPDPEDIQDSDDCVLMARGMGGRYSISARQLVSIPSPDNMGYLLWDADDAFSFTEHLTIDAAKAAAQADHERRIRSALVSPEARS